MSDNSIEGIVRNVVNKKDHLEISGVRKAYMHQTGLVIEMSDGTYLTRKELRSYVNGQSTSNREYIQDDNWFYDSVIGWVKVNNGLN